MGERFPVTVWPQRFKTPIGTFMELTPAGLEKFNLFSTKVARQILVAMVPFAGLEWSNPA